MHPTPAEQYRINSAAGKCGHCGGYRNRPGYRLCSRCYTPATRTTPRRNHPQYVLVPVPGPATVACCGRWHPITQIPFTVLCCGKTFFVEAR